jgi:hypothetical protein
MKERHGTLITKESGTAPASRTVILKNSKERLQLIHPFMAIHLEF